MKRPINLLMIAFIFTLLLLIFLYITQVTGQSYPLLSTNDSTNEIQYGLAAQYPNDEGIKSNPSVIFASGFEAPNWYAQDFNYTGWLSEIGHRVADPNLVFSGGSALEYQSFKGEHLPNVMHVASPEQDIAYLRWYRRGVCKGWGGEMTKHRA